jgi:hypothetical protein
MRDKFEVYQKWAKLKISLKKTAQQEAKKSRDKSEPGLSGDTLDFFEKKYFLNQNEVLQIIKFSSFWRSKFKKNQITNENNNLFTKFFIKFTNIFSIYY